MYSKYNIPQYKPNMQNYSVEKMHYSNDERFFGGFAAPFILGGITGSLLTPRYNNYPPAPPIYVYPSVQTYPPYYSTTTNYY